MLLLGINRLAAQAPTQVIIANGGNFGVNNMVTVGTLNVTNGSYMVFDSFPGSSVQNVFIWGNDAYVCADSTLMKYDLTTLTRRAEALIHGCRQTAVYQDKVIVTKGFGTLQNTPWLEVRYATNLGVTFTVPGVTDNTEGVVVVGDTAYIANPGLYLREKGDLAVLDMANQSLKRVMDMDTMGEFIQELYVHNNKIFTINISQFNGPSFGFISEYDIPTASFVHHRINYPLYIGAGINDDLLYLSIGDNIGAYDLNTNTVVDPNIIPGSFAAMAIDSVNDLIYATKTDYATYGKIYKYTLTGTLLDSTNIGISPEAIAVDYNAVVSAPSPVTGDNLVKAYPQPFGNQLHVDLRHLNAPAKQLAMYDLSGRKVLGQALAGNGIVALSTDGLPAGVYVLQVQTAKGVATIKVVKTQD